MRTKSGMTDIQAVQQIRSEPPAEAVVYWRALRRRWHWPLLLLLVGCLAGAGFSVSQPTLYQAAALVELQPLNKAFLDADQVSPKDMDSALRAEIETMVRVLRSRGLSDQTVAALREEGLAPEALADAAASFRVSPSGSSRIVELHAKSRDPATAARYLNTLAEGYLDGLRGERKGAAEDTAAWLEARLSEHRDRLEESERRLQQYAGSSGLPMLRSSNLNDAEKRLSDLESELLGVRSDAMRLRAEAQAADPSAADSEMLRSRLQRLAELRRRHAELDALYTPEHYQVLQVLAQIEEVELAVEQERTRLQAQASQELDAVKRREALLSEAVERQREQVAEAAAMAVRYQTLERETAANRDLFEKFLERARQAGVAAAAPGEAARLVEQASEPVDPSTPGLGVAATVGGFTGLFIGLLGALFFERIDRTFRAPGEIAARLGIAELGFLIETRTRRERSMTAAGDLTRAREAEAEKAEGRSKGSAAAECLRGLRTSLETAGARGRAPRSIAITSPGPGDGKTTLAVGLAGSLTELRDRVLLVDADLRRPRVHEAFGLRNEIGLADLLADESLDWRSVVRQAPGRAGLFILSSGVAPFGGPGLLHSARLPELLGELQREYGSVVLDTPPVLAVSDARVLAAAADCTVLTVRADRTDPEEAAEAARLIEAVGASLAGAVLNGWNPRRAGYGAYGAADAYFRRPQGRRHSSAAA